MTRLQSILAMVLLAFVASACGLLSGGGDVEGWPEVDLGADIEVFKSTDERDLHLHIFRPPAGPDAPPAVLFFHGGGFRSTRVGQFEHQARAVSEAGMVGIIVEYRVTAEGTSRSDAVADGADALAVVRANAARFGVDPERLAMSGSSAGGALALEATAMSSANAVVLFNPAVGGGDARFDTGVPTLLFHSREDSLVPFASAEAFCSAVAECRLDAFDEGDHGFFNDEPALTETTDAMIEFLRSHGF